MPTITRLSLADATAAQLETRIAAGEWAIGARLPTETDFMVELGIGRSTVREAVRTLVRVGLVQVRQGDGTYVTGQRADNEPLWLRCQRAQLHEIYDVREALDLQAARLAAERRSEEDLVAMRELLDERAASLAARDARRYADADVAFHQRIVAATQNEMLIDLYRVLGQSLVLSLTMHKRQSEFSDIDTTGEHEALLAAITVRDAAAATQAVTTLFRRGRYIPRPAPGVESAL
ncbi:MAG: FadR family transcriptional regulator [Gemmatimonadaceae bacterium]|nr:FadR family transcriptional regulator [Gemmatimonadaceae bacterium]